MKKLFIYYSLSGNGDIVSSFFKKNGYDICKVKTLEELPKNSFFRILSGGFKAMIGYKDNIEFNSNISEYDEIVIGSPIWNGRLSSPIFSLIDKIDLNGKKIRFVLYSGSGVSKGAFKQILKKYGKVKIIDLKEPKKYSNELKKLEGII